MSKLSLKQKALLDKMLMKDWQKKAQEIGCKVVTNYNWLSEIASLKFEKPSNIKIRRKYYASGIGLRQR
ncbi:MAG: hypothetical protein AABW91_04565 [Nanoarchaeota archaeon]